MSSFTIKFCTHYIQTQTYQRREKRVSQNKQKFAQVGYSPNLIRRSESAAHRNLVEPWKSASQVIPGITCVSQSGLKKSTFTLFALFSWKAPICLCYQLSLRIRGLIWVLSPWTRRKISELTSKSVLAETISPHMVSRMCVHRCLASHNFPWLAEVQRQDVVCC
jgi:hypothetical protein